MANPPIFFNVPEARAQLIEKGAVYTLRKCKETKSVRPVRITTARWGSYFDKNKKIGKVEVRYVTTFTSWDEMKDEIRPFVGDSGFKTVDEWISQVKKLTGNEIGIGKCVDLFLVVKR